MIDSSIKTNHSIEHVVTPQVKLSIITPAYNEAENLEDLHKQLRKTLTDMAITWEWLIIDDCSKDSTITTATNLAKRDPVIRVIRFSRNFGSHMAITCGLSKSRGECAVVMAADLQDSPETIRTLFEKWQQGKHIVWAVRKERQAESWRTLLFARMYYFLMRHIIGMKELPPTGSDFFLIDRRVIDALSQFKEKNNNIFSLIAWLGFRQDHIHYIKQPRNKGKSNWTLRKQIKLLVDSITSYSYLPIRVFSMIGFLTATSGFLYALFILFHSLLAPHHATAGWSSLIMTILILGGLQMLMLGILGEYLWRTLDHTRNRPIFLIEEEYER